MKQTALVGIFFGSDTGNTKKVTEMIQTQLGKKNSDSFDISYCSKEDIENYNKLIFGIPTWYYGEPQSDWESFLPIFENINFFGKKVAIFGCGDQEDYSEYFCDAMNILYKISLNNGAHIVGKWPAAQYYFNTSKSIINDNQFVGLAIDEDRQPAMTKDRVHTWVNQLRNEMDLNFN